MLSNLYISDLALIRRLSLDLKNGFSVLTGATGAGKSLILDALGLFLKQKGAKELVREGAEKMEVSLFFDDLSEQTAQALSEYFSPEEIEEGITLTRIVTKEGKSTCKAGGRTVSFSYLEEISRRLLSIQGQTAAGGLFDDRQHRKYLDAALPSEGQAILSEYRALYREYSECRKNLTEWKKEALEEKEKLSLYEYQMKEIAAAKPRAGEEEKLEEKLASLQAYEKIYAALSTADRALSGGEKGRGAVYLTQGAAGKLEALGENDPMHPLSAELYEVAERLREIAGEVSYRLSELGEEDPGELSDKIRRRLDVLYRLKLKYGATVEEVISFYEELKRKKDLTLTRKDDIKRAAEKLQGLEKALREKAAALTLARKKLAERLEEQIHSVLAFLHMEKTRFSVVMTPCEPGPDGAEEIVFAIAANTGEGSKPLSQVASGGEGNRLALALHLKLGGARDADTMIFDEVDTGISGATAQKIGIALKTLSAEKQILCVTHSAQVSTLADHHYLVEKREKDGRTETDVTLLEGEGVLMENARLFAGATMTSQARLAAAELAREGMEEYEKWKDTVL